MKLKKNEKWTASRTCVCFMWLPQLSRGENKDYSFTDALCAYNSNKKLVQR
jgi:hypothetical protein